MPTKAEVVATGRRLYAQGHVDVGDLAANIARAVGPGGAIYAGTAAAQIVNAGGVRGAAKDVADTLTGGTASAVTDAAGVVRDAVELPTRILRWLGDPGTWIRISYIIGGGILILIGARVVVEGKADTAVKTVAGIAKKVGGKG